jgi:hypothetical protein
MFKATAQKQGLGWMFQSIATFFLVAFVFSVVSQVIVEESNVIAPVMSGMVSDCPVRCKHLLPGWRCLLLFAAVFALFFVLWILRPSSNGAVDRQECPNIGTA